MDPRPVKQSAQPPSGGTPLRSRGTTLRQYKSASLGGRSPPRVRFRLARGSDDPRARTPPRSGAGHPLSREAPPRSRAERPLKRVSISLEGVHRPAASMPAPPAGAFNALTLACIKSKVNPRHHAPENHAPALLRQLPWRGHPRHCVTLCGVVSNRPAALYHPLPYGRRTTPSKKDGGTLEGMTHDYSAPARDDAVTSSQRELSPPSPSALCDCKTPDFHRKPESLYHRDSPWISGYRVQNVSQMNIQSHTTHHIKIIVHKIITSPLWSTSIQASWLNQSENSTQR
jgi:hypothetical protein